MTADNDSTDTVDATVEATAQLTSVDADSVFMSETDDTGVDMSGQADSPLGVDEHLELRVLVQELAELWERREAIRQEQPLDVGPNGEEYFGTDADEMAVRLFERVDENIARILFENQGLIIEYLAADIGGDE